MEGIWKEYGRNMDGIWTEYGRNMKGIWKEYGRNMYGIWTEYGRNSDGSCRGLNEVLSQHSRGGIDENYKNYQVSTPGDPTEIRTELLRRESVEHCL
jgi:hypothetical protein